DITIGVFDDRVEISNPGTLPEPLTPKDLKKKHKSTVYRASETPHESKKKNLTKNS
ncbi:MAG TPA: hypothetical protein C5S37_12890, partial [Methanophagales archaeon]|nr:hypothetical protein [Methanophagales archaeon]